MGKPKEIKDFSRMATQIAVIDFETANSRSSSACQLGVVRLEDWRIVEEKEWLIRPQRLYFSPQCVRVHGITARDCLTSPEWDRVWDDLHPLIDGCVIIAHNVGFDGRFQFRGLGELGVQFGDEARLRGVRFSPNGTTGCSHGREPVVTMRTTRQKPHRATLFRILGCDFHVKFAKSFSF